MSETPKLELARKFGEFSTGSPSESIATVGPST